MKIIERPIRPTLRGVVSAIFAGLWGILSIIPLSYANLMHNQNPGSAPTSGDIWEPLILVLVGSTCLVSAIGFVLGQRRAVFIFLIPCIVLLIYTIPIWGMLAYLIQPPCNNPSCGDAAFGRVIAFFAIVFLTAFTGTGFLIAAVMWFQRKWLSIVGLPLVGLILVPVLIFLLSNNFVK